MKSNIFKLIYLCVFSLSLQCDAAIFEAESLRFSEIIEVKNATFESRVGSTNLTTEVASACTGQYMCTINLQEMMGNNFMTPYDFKIDYETTRHRNTSAKHKEKLGRINPTITIKGIKSHVGTVARWIGVTSLFVTTIAAL